MSVHRTETPDSNGAPRTDLPAHLAATLTAEQLGGPSAIGVIADLDRPDLDQPDLDQPDREHADTDVELAVRAIAHPRDLIGFWGPPEWTAFGVVATGTTHRPDAAAPERVAIAHFVDRRGNEANHVSIAGRPAEFGDQPPFDGALGSVGPVVGTVPDVCRRVLGVPTPPPTVGTATLLAHEWLDAMLEARLDADLAHPRFSWSDAVACLQFMATPPPDPDPLAVAAHGIAVVADWPWAIIRREATLVECPLWNIWPNDAAWMDDGMFSREVLSRQAPLHEVFADLIELLPAAVMLRISTTLDTWAVDPHYDRMW